MSAVATARSAYVAAKIAYDSAYSDFQSAYRPMMRVIADVATEKIDSNTYTTAKNLHDNICTKYEVTKADFLAARTAYVSLVGNDRVDICRNIANQPIYEALLTRAYGRAASVIRTMRYSLFDDDELIWDSELVEMIGDWDIVKFIDSVIHA
jgi:hypothetical protein